MPFLLDTNILLRYIHTADSEHSIVLQSVERLYRKGEVLHFAPQCAAEFWNVSTRPVEKSGYGLGTEETAEMLGILEGLFSMLPDEPQAYGNWRSLVTKGRVSGVQVHDARLVAWMLTHGVMSILTINVGDFRRYESLVGISVASPESVLER